MPARRLLPLFVGLACPGLVLALVLTLASPAHACGNFRHFIRWYQEHHDPCQKEWSLFMLMACQSGATYNGPAADRALAQVLLDALERGDAFARCPFRDIGMPGLATGVRQVAPAVEMPPGVFLHRADSSVRLLAGALFACYNGLWGARGTPAYEMLRRRLGPPYFFSRGQHEIFSVTALSGARLRSGPGTEHAVLSVLTLGTLVDVAATNGDWAEVDIPAQNLAVPAPSTHRGWVHRSLLAPY